LVALNKLLNVMLRQIAIKVKKKRPEALKNTVEWAYDI